MNKRLKKLLRKLSWKSTGISRQKLREIKKDNQDIRRVIGLSLEDGSPIFEPNTSLSWTVYGGAGSGKSTCVAVPAIMSLLADKSRSIIVNDVKPELAHQVADMCLKWGRKFVVIDDSEAMGKDYPHRVGVNPLSNLISAYEHNSPDLLLEIESFAKVLINEPDGDTKNFYFRQTPREFAMLAALILLDNNLELLTPGGLAAFIGDPETFDSAVDIEAEEGGPLTKSRARQIRYLRENDPEHYSTHLLSILSATQHFAEGGPLHEAGRNAEITHEELLKENYIVCVCQKSKNASNLAAYYGLHFNAFLSAQMEGDCGRTILVLDEAANTPAKDLISKVTIFRSAGLQVLYIAQSRSDMQRQNGDKIIATLEDNTALQVLQVANPEEAERYSKAIGEVENVSYSLNETTGKIELSRSINIGRERLLSADTLMNLPANYQLLYIPGVGWVLCEKISQQNLGPLAFDLAPSPQEGGTLTPDIKVMVPTNAARQS